jgi:hypothetical protein
MVTLVRIETPQNPSNSLKIVSFNMKKVTYPFPTLIQPVTLCLQE